MASERRTPRPGTEIDLHGLSPEQALAKLARELHTARLLGTRSVLVIHGRGVDQAKSTPVLRGKVEAWLASGAGRLRGVERFEIDARSKGGALIVHLTPRGPVSRAEAEDLGEEWDEDDCETHCGAAGASA